MRSGFADFSALLAEGRVQPLDWGVAFSRSLAYAAGVESLEDLEELTGAMAGIARQEAALRRREAEEARLQRRRAEEARRRDRESVRQVKGDGRHDPNCTGDDHSGDDEGPRDDQTAQWQRLRQEPLAGTLAAAAHPAADERPGAARVSVPEQTTATLPDLPMGAWLGFHDGEAPLLARLAAHDRQADTYLFVNRMGIKLRELHKDELLALVQRGDAEVLEARATFREAVNRLRGTVADCATTDGKDGG